MSRSFLGRVGKMIMLQTLLLAALATSGSVAAIVGRKLSLDLKRLKAFSATKS